jgi:hypothetical protein
MQGVRAGGEGEALAEGPASSLEKKSSPSAEAFVEKTSWFIGEFSARGVRCPTPHALPALVSASQTAVVFCEVSAEGVSCPRRSACLDHRQDAGSDRRRQARPCLDHRGEGRVGGSEGTSGGTSTTVPLFPPRNPGLAVRLQIRHRRFDSDRSLSALDPCELPELPGFAGVFCVSEARCSAEPTTRNGAPGDPSGGRMKGHHLHGI